MTQALVLIDIVLYRIFVRLKDTRFDLVCAGQAAQVRPSCRSG